MKQKIEGGTNTMEGKKMKKTLSGIVNRALKKDTAGLKKAILVLQAKKIGHRFISSDEESIKAFLGECSMCGAKLDDIKNCCNYCNYCKGKLSK